MSWHFQAYNPETCLGPQPPDLTYTKLYSSVVMQKPEPCCSVPTDFFTQLCFNKLHTCRRTGSRVQCTVWRGPPSHPRRHRHRPLCQEPSGSQSSWPSGRVPWKGMRSVDMTGGGEQREGESHIIYYSSDWNLYQYSLWVCCTMYRSTCIFSENYTIRWDEELRLKLLSRINGKQAEVPHLTLCEALTPHTVNGLQYYCLPEFGRRSCTPGGRSPWVTGKRRV